MPAPSLLLRALVWGSEWSCVLAGLRARIEVINDWLDRRGVMADKRSGRLREILATLERSQAAVGTVEAVGYWSAGARRDARLP